LAKVNDSFCLTQRRQVFLLKHFAPWRLGVSNKIKWTEFQNPAYGANRLHVSDEMVMVL
jgi:hypothetical protein